ncbi:MAG: glycosyltransferase family 39 protein [Anaerolineales bacterium]|nr:glycosyltransferase family 39 protein [Anaerolineales bacterium]
MKTRIDNFLQLPSMWKTVALFIIILTLGIFARVWEFGSLPAGLNPDEASIGVEAYYIYKFGMDRSGMSYPVHLISWGSGQNALYAYLLIPFVALRGINEVSVRLPMLLSGILSLPLVFMIGDRLFGRKYAFLAMFFLAISPWHIVNNRWAVESNIMPFFFLAGFTALVMSGPKNGWFIAALALFALCLYAYGTAYVGVPVFLLLVTPVLFYSKQLSVSQAIAGFLVFFLIAIPIALFVAVNTLQMDTLHLGLLTIPRLPVEARYETMTAVFGENPLAAINQNAAIMVKTLWSQEDAFPWNFVAPFGYFYKYTLPLAAAGFLLTLPFIKLRENWIERWFLFSWVAASLVIGILHPVNLTRINLIFTPILLCIALLLLKLDQRYSFVLPATVLVLSVAFLFFNQAYHGEEYRKRASAIFNEGIIPAITFASEKDAAQICFTEQRYSLYIYVLLTQKYHPSEYLDQLEWLDPLDPADPARTPRALMKYRFRLNDCAGDRDAIYILTLKEEPPASEIEYKEKKFGKFLVFLPK